MVDLLVLATDGAKDLQIRRSSEAGAGQPQIGLIARPASRSYEGRRRRHRTAGASPVFAKSGACRLAPNCSLSVGLCDGAARAPNALSGGSGASGCRLASATRPERPTVRDRRSLGRRGHGASRRARAQRNNSRAIRRGARPGAMVRRDTAPGWIWPSQGRHRHRRLGPWWDDRPPGNPIVARLVRLSGAAWLSLGRHQQRGESPWTPVRLTRRSLL